MTDDNDDDILKLSDNALAALQAFRAEKEEIIQQFSQLNASAELQFQKRVTMDLFQEDWQLSQFWVFS